MQKIIRFTLFATFIAALSFVPSAVAPQVAVAAVATCDTQAECWSDDDAWWEENCIEWGNAYCCYCSSPARRICVEFPSTPTYH